MYEIEDTFKWQGEWLLSVKKGTPREYSKRLLADVINRSIVNVHFRNKEGKHVYTSSSASFPANNYVFIRTEDEKFHCLQTMDETLEEILNSVKEHS
jgi:hypothetical protein